MRNALYLSLLGLALAAPLGAQTVYDVAGAVDQELSGTARFVSMGGAMNALGGDISTISVNPAGIGVFRSSEIQATGGLTFHGARNESLDGVFKRNTTRGEFDNIGFVYSSKIGNTTSLRYLNFGFNYHRANDFYRISQFSGNLDEYSQTFYMAAQADGITDWGQSPYNDDNVGWLSAIGYDGYLLHPTSETGHYYGMYAGGLGKAWTRESGALHVYDFNVSANFNDRLYLGFSIGAYDMHYKKAYDYGETYLGEEEGQFYELQSGNQLYGMGVNFKFGAIWRPVEESPFRLGLAIHTPTFYELTYRTGAALESRVWSRELGEYQDASIRTWDRLGGKNMERRFQLQSPWLFNVSAGTTIGGKFAIDAEYQLQDFSTVRFRDIDGYSAMFSFENSTRHMMRAVHQIKVGAEIKPIPEFAIRLGYNYATSVFNEDSFKDLPYYSIQTDTDFSNRYKTNNFTCGLGYRGDVFYADLAFRYQVYHSDYYPFVNVIENTVYSPDMTKNTNSRKQLLLTMGVRF